MGKNGSDVAPARVIARPTVRQMMQREIVKSETKLYFNCYDARYKLFEKQNMPFRFT
ncbi:hypothetical protein KIN20_003497 [Parelaphostrongylus tenuis]|uniref:Uncharacterized protein n=1 Tax=Parelaphostrongylus tenuis TaxID=148309 RepID=A0AAD5MIC9_PARTN|nr:hypothetical protein KIN20_003497 [Parelaphostrongylus tenuis]